MIYNPPNLQASNEITQGTIERQNFVEYYGGYVEIIYLLCNGDLTKADDVLKWNIERFLYQGEYLLRKK